MDRRRCRARRGGSCDAAALVLWLLLLIPFRRAAAQPSTSIAEGSQTKITSVGQSIRPRDEGPQSNGSTYASRHLRPRNGGRIDITAMGNGQ